MLANAVVVNSLEMETSIPFMNNVCLCGYHGQGSGITFVLELGDWLL